MGTAELCCDSLSQTSSRQVRQEGAGKSGSCMGGATGWRLLQNNREVLNWTQDTGRITQSGVPGQDYAKVYISSPIVLVRCWQTHGCALAW